MRRSIALAGFVIGLVALIIEVFLIVALSMDAGRGFFGSLVYTFSFFTILTNLGLVLIYLGAIVRGQRWLIFFRKPHTRAMAAAAIALTGRYYHFVLSGMWHQEGLLYWCNIALHYVAPLLYLVWFAVWNRSGTLKWQAVLTLLAYPLIYLVYVLIRGALTGEYPYEMFDAAARGYASVAISSGFLLVVFIILNAIAVAIDRSLLAGKRH